jgi:DUF3096 family protein
MTVVELRSAGCTGRSFSTAALAATCAIRHHGGGPVAASAGPPGREARGANMTISIGNLQPIVAILAGILILIMPRLLNYIVAIYLIVIGILGLGILR